MTPDHTQAIEPTARQLAHWIDQGWLHPRRGGRGRPWTWTDTEWATACLMARLAHAGLRHNVAADVARIHTTRGGPVELAPGLVLHIDDASAGP